jgi:hypothetical protein
MATEVVGAPLPKIVASVSLTGQTGSIASTPLCAPATGVYRISAVATTTTAGSAGTVTNAFTYANREGARSLSAVAPTLQLNAVNAPTSGASVIHAVTGTNIAFATTVASAAGSPVYAIDITVEQLA